MPVSIPTTALSTSMPPTLLNVSGIQAQQQVHSQMPATSWGAPSALPASGPGAPWSGPPTGGFSPNGPPSGHPGFPGGGGPPFGGPPFGGPPFGGPPSGPPSGGGGGPGLPSGSYPFPYYLYQPTPSVQRLTPKMDPIKLNEHNWVLWSRFVHAMLIEVGVERCIQEDMQGHVEDFKAQSLIMQVQ